MAYYPDLSLYCYALPRRYRATYGVLRAYPDALNIGWQDVAHTVPTDGPEPDDAFLNALFEHCRYPVHRMRGSHGCPFCPRTPSDVRIVRRNGRRVALGSGEILVVGADGTAFLAPTLVYHYVTEHRYRPPDAFGNALRVSDPRGSIPLRREEREAIGFGAAFDEELARQLLWQEEAPDPGKAQDRDP